MPKQKQLCSKHNTPLQYSGKLHLYYCKDCLYASFLTSQAQREAVTRYQHTSKFKASQEKYRKGTGKEARERYLHSDKYKQRRKEYNERLKESLAIARQAHLERTSVTTKVELVRTETLAPLIQDIREFIDSRGQTPRVQVVKQWASNIYSTTLTDERAREIINQAHKRR